MEIKINDQWKIKSNELNVILCKRKKNKKGEVVWKSVGYYPKIEQAIDRLFDENIYDSGATSFEELKNDIIKFRQDVVRAVNQK